MWKKTSDELPPINTPVLAYLSGDPERPVRELMLFERDGRKYWDAHLDDGMLYVCFEVLDVTHWMDMPEGPEED